jgi:hypothetical protein
MPASPCGVWGLKQSRVSSYCMMKIQPYYCRITSTVYLDLMSAIRPALLLLKASASALALVLDSHRSQCRGASLGSVPVPSS